MSRGWSVSAKRSYVKARVCRLWGVAHPTQYVRQAAARQAVASARRGRRPKVSDEALVEAIRQVLSEAEALGFTGEGYRKVWMRLRYKGISGSKKRVAVKRAHSLQPPIATELPEDRRSMTERSSPGRRTGCGATMPRR